MYEEFYGLSDKPFSTLPDPRFLYWGRRHELGFATLEYGVLNQAGFTLLTGEVGSGKTTLVRHLIDELDEEITVGVVANTQEGMGNLLEWVMLAFGQPYEGLSVVALYDRLQQFLVREHAAHRRVLLVVDEAQNLGPKSLEELRMLSNMNVGSDQLLQMILVGQPELKNLLRQPELRQFAQRVAADFDLTPLDLDDVQDYIEHRLQVAGCDRQLFTPEACARIAEASQGVPRVINILCDTALVYGYSDSLAYIDVELVDSVIDDKNEYGVFGIGGEAPS